MNKKVGINKIYPLSPMQEGMLFHSLANKNSKAYFEQSILTVKGDFDIETINKSFNKLVNSFDALRTVFSYENTTKPRQVVLNERDTEVYYADLTVIEEDKIDMYVNNYVNQDREKGFNLKKDVLIRLSIFKTGSRVYKFAWSFHHIIMDGWCIGIIIKTFFNIYKSIINNVEYEVLKNSEYSEYIYWLDKQSKEQAKEYWNNYLDRYDTGVSVLGEKVSLINDEYIQKKYKFKIIKEYMNKLENIAMQNNITINTVIQSVWGIILHRYNAVDDVVFGAVVSGRNHKIPDIETIVGLFINTVPVRIKIDKEMSFKELLIQVQKNAFASAEFDYYPLSEIQALSTVKQKLISSIMIFENYYVSDEVKNSSLNQEMDFEIMDFDCFEQTNYNFELTVVPGEEIEVQLAYNFNIFDEQVVERVGNHFINVIKEVSDNPDLLVSKINMLLDEEKKTIIEKFNKPLDNFKDRKVIHQLFQEQVEMNPSKIAIEFNNNTLTYKELNEKSNQLARTLREKGVHRNLIVGLMVDKSIEMIVGILGILKAGGAYLPIDPQYPQERIEYMLKDGNCGLIVTKSNINKENIKCDYICIDDESILCKNKTDLDNINAEGDLVYVIYTSGTTGQAKGVMVEHKNLVSATYAWREQYLLDNFDVNLLQIASISFDVFTGDFCRSILNGGTMYVCDNNVRYDVGELSKLLVKHKISIFESTPSLIVTLMDYIYEMNIKLYNLKLLIIGSDICPVDDYKNIKLRSRKNFRVINSYGVTEATIDSSYYEENVEKIEAFSNTPIGKPMKNTTMYILDKYLRPQPIGGIGELYIGGNGVARGYLNKNELTEERFIANPFKEGGKLYKTGDYGRWLKDGNIEFLGRKDNQVKIRGFRVETGDIEKQLLSHKDICEAIVIDKEDINKVKYLCAYIVAKCNLDLNQIKKYLESKLPIYMIPKKIIQIESIPLTQHGKVDRKLLSSLEDCDDSIDDLELPRNNIEKILVQIWTEVLGVKKLGINSNFFEVGGDSIKIIQISARIQKFGYRLEISDFFNYPTIKELSVYVKEISINICQDEVVGEVELTPIQKWFFEQKFDNMNHWNQAVMLFRKEGFDSKILSSVFEEIIKHHDALRMTYKFDGENVIQFNRSSKENLGFLVNEFNCYGDDYKEVIAEEANILQQSIKINEGLLLKISHFKTKEGDYLLIIIHHLVIDGVSWRILLEDFSTGYKQMMKQQKIVFQQRTHSYKEWANQLKKQAKYSKFKNETNYWIDISKRKISHIKMDYYDGENRMQDLKTATFEISKEQTNALLTSANRVYSTKINEILLTALSISLKGWAENDLVLINMEGHGREECIEEIDISRTIGWFTSEYPVLLDMGKCNDVGYSIKYVKETFRHIPNNGMGYMLLKYSLEDEDKEKFKLNPQISFNYLGQFNEITNNVLFDVSQLSTGNSESLDSKRTYILDVSAIILNNKLSITIQYSRNQYKTQTVYELANRYSENLQKIIEHCMHKNEIELTPTDLGDKDITIEQLNRYSNKLKDKFDDFED